MNWWLLGATVITTLFTLAAIYLPGLSTAVFDIEPGQFEARELLISVALAVSTVPVFELGKLIRRKSNK